MDKVAMLREILNASPKDAFARYGLAMEYAGRNEFPSALAEFAALLGDHPDYVPGYFMAAQTLVKAGQPEQAKQHLQQGLAAARSTGNTHAQNEMQAMLDELELDS